jgi:aryl-alcohol dehydrogenase-like predicted oxidoreductase
MAQKPWIVPIPGTTMPKHLEENLGAVAIDLTPDELKEIRAKARRSAPGHEQRLMILRSRK